MPCLRGACWRLAAWAALLAREAAQLCAARRPGHFNVTVMGREALVYAPAVTAQGGRDQRLPGVFVLHGSGGVAKDMCGLGFEPLADELGFLVVYPEMPQPRADSWGFAADLPYFAALLRRLAAGPAAGLPRLDPARASVAGHSAGGTMALFLQNEATLFGAAAAVEAGVGRADTWNKTRRGKRTMLVWNHADPVLEEYGGERLYRETVDVLRRRPAGGPLPRPAGPPEPLPSRGPVRWAELRRYPSDETAPELLELSFETQPGTHAWPRQPPLTFDATERLVDFFLRPPPPDETETTVVV